MWNYEKVERALFRWQKWRQSIIAQWRNLDVEIESLSLEQIKTKARREVQNLGFPANLWLELYWVCCISSDYNLDYHTSFDNIMIPHWLPLPFDPSLRYYKIESRTRHYPPPIYNEQDVEFEVHRWGNPQLRELRYKNWEHVPSIFLPSRHELYNVLRQLRGRTLGRSHIVGRYPCYPDRLVVKCASLKDTRGMTYQEIDETIESLDYALLEGRPSGGTAHLVSRGRKLITSLGNLSVVGRSETPVRD